MQVICGQHNIRAVHHGCVATIGNFDGVHLGHQAVLSALKKRAGQHQLPALVIIFEPQPMEFFCPDKAPARLARLREKLALIRQAGVDRVLILRFNQALANQSAEDFVTQLLVQQLGIRHLYVGDDFRFGRQRSGDFALLQTMGAAHHFQVESLPTLKQGTGRISSTRIRAALAAGDLTEAEKLLGRRYSVQGRVGHGHQIGRKIGFPTLNLPLHRLHSPIRGVFVVEVTGLAGGTLQGVANVGNRPILQNDDRFLLEVYLFNFAREVYGEQVSVVFLKRLRDELKFDSFDAMRTQIERDIADANTFFAGK